MNCGGAHVDILPYCASMARQLTLPVCFEDWPSSCFDKAKNLLSLGMSVTTEAKKRIRESETSRAIPSFAYIEGRWDSVSPEDVRQCMKIKPDDWKLAYHERADHRYRIAIQTIARHEERYIKEWIKHHLEIGVDHIFIYDNNAVSYPCLFLAGREIIVNVF